MIGRIDPSAMAPGFWDVVVRNPDGIEGVSGTPFQVAETSSVSATYTSGEIPTDPHFTELPGLSNCPGTLTVTIPPDARITSVDVEYEMTHGDFFPAEGGGWVLPMLRDQRSWLRCVSPGGEGEPTMAHGPPPAADQTSTWTYFRTGLRIANQVSGGGDIAFELHAGNTRFGDGCDTVLNKVDNGTWTVTVHFHSLDPVSIFAASQITSDLGGGWKWNALGYLYDPVYPYVYAGGTGGWVYVLGKSEAAYYFWSFSDQHWAYTGAEFYPYFLIISGNRAGEWVKTTEGE